MHKSQNGPLLVHKPQILYALRIFNEGLKTVFHPIKYMVFRSALIHVENFMTALSSIGIIS